MEKEPEKSGESLFCFGGLEVDFLRYECRKNGKELSLTSREFELLKYFLQNRGRVINRDELLDEIWGKDVFVAPRTVDTHMAHLRKKIENDPARPRFITSIRGVGYKFISE